MFGPLKVAIEGVYVSIEEDVKNAAHSLWRTHPKTLFSSGITKFAGRWTSCTEEAGNYRGAD
jgi:hypothetical protein